MNERIVERPLRGMIAPIAVIEHPRLHADVVGVALEHEPPCDEVFAEDGVNLAVDMEECRLQDLLLALEVIVDHRLRAARLLAEFFGRRVFQPVFAADIADRLQYVRTDVPLGHSLTSLFP